jgi:DNA-binding SARP family transcriptional activator/tetratricopeptide (TPR) repeat protein
MAAFWNLKLLGGISITGPRGQLSGPAVQDRRLALLAVLAMQSGGAARRDRVVALLWPESPVQRARHSLSDAVYVLNKSFGGRAILASGDELRLDKGVVDCDVDLFDAALSAGAWEEAVDLYRGPFLDGFHVSGSVEFEEWAGIERQRLERACARALERLAEEADTRGDPEAAVRWWTRRSVQDPYDARVAVCLMEALARAGDRAGAIRHARAHGELLRRELETEPDAVVVDLARRLQREAVPWTEDTNRSTAEVIPGANATEDRAPARKTNEHPWLLPLLMVLVVLASWAAWPRSEPDLTPEERLAGSADPGIAVLPFRVSDPTLAPWGEGMVDLLSFALDGVPDLRAIDSRTVLARWEEVVAEGRTDLATSLMVARRTGARYALVGSLVTIGGEVRLTADLYQAREGDKVATGSVTGSPDSMLSLVDRLSMAILQELPLETGGLAGSDLATVTTDSIDALKAYLNGEASYRRGEFQKAAVAFERAIRSDSTFALAWVRLGDACSWSPVPSSSMSTPGWGTELCQRIPDPWPESLLQRLPGRVSEFMRATDAGVAALEQLTQKYPDDSRAWFLLGDAYIHWGGMVLKDRAEADRAFERAIALDPGSPEPYLHRIEDALADADSARAQRLMRTYERITRGSKHPGVLAFELGFGDPATRARALSALDTIPTPALFHTTQLLGHPRLIASSEAPVRTLLTRADLDGDSAFRTHYRRGHLRLALNSLSDPGASPGLRALRAFRVHQVGGFPSEDELGPILAAATADTPLPHDGPFFLLVGAHALDRGLRDEYLDALERERALARAPHGVYAYHDAADHVAAARALEGYALWKDGRRADAVRALEEAQRTIPGGELARYQASFSFNVIVRWWLGDLMRELGRPHDAARYFRSISADPFAALRLASVYEDLKEPGKALESYEYALASLSDADPELQPLVTEARRAAARLGRE